jgi:hypothetical protein
MRASRLYRTLALALVLAFPDRAAAESARTVSLQWVGADVESGCLGRTELAAAVENLLGRSAFSAEPSQLRVVVAMEPRESSGPFKWRARVRIENRSGAVLGERELVSETESCASLNEPLAFAVVLMVDSELPKPAPAPPPAQKTPKRRRAAAHESGAEAGHGEWLTLDAAILGAFGALPEPTLGGDLGIELALLRWFALRFHVAALLPRSRAASAAAKARFGAYDAGVLACPNTTFGPLRVAGCAGFDAGLLTARAQGFDSGINAQRPFFGFSTALQARLRLGTTSSAGASAGAVFPYRRERFVYDVEEERRVLFEMARMWVLVGVGAAFEF